MGDWQPIETAPKIEDEELFVCSYESGGLYFCDVVTWVPWADEERGGWFNGDVAHSADYYSHWMPLPPHPRSP